MSKKQQTIDTYNTTAPRMAQKFNDIWTRTIDIEKAFSLVEKSEPFVLEIGCGNGRDAREILKYSSHYTGMDISESIIRLSQETNPENADKFMVADVENYDFPVWLDIVFSFASLLHTPKEQLQTVLKKLHTTLNEGGITYLSLKFSEAYEEVTKTDEFGTRTYYHYTPEDILGLGGDLFASSEIEYQELSGQKWFTIVLCK